MNRTIPRPVLVVVITVNVVGALAGCRGGEDQVAVDGSASPETSATSTTAPAPTSTLPATTTQAPTPAESSTTAHPTTRRAPPKVVVPKQGDRVVAVFVATGTTLADPSFAQAKARLNRLGYKGYSGGDTYCSQGAKEALPQLQEYSLSVQFAGRAEADRFAALYGPVLGTATVTVFCAD